MNESKLTIGEWYTLIQRQWARVANVIPNTASPEQVRDMRTSFYAGVSAILRIQWAAGTLNMSEQEVLAIINGMQGEA